MLVTWVLASFHNEYHVGEHKSKKNYLIHLICFNSFGSILQFGEGKTESRFIKTSCEVKKTMHDERIDIAGHRLFCSKLIVD